MWGFTIGGMAAWNALDAVAVHFAPTRDDRHAPWFFTLPFVLDEAIYNIPANVAAGNAGRKR